jgi:HSP20 family protein
MLRRFGQPGEETWVPRMDVFEQNGQLIIKVELPGVEKKDVTVRMEDGDLVLEGKRNMEKEVREEDYYRLERAYGRFHRRLPIPFEVKGDQVKAAYRDGVLEVRIPKPAQATPAPTQIAIT